jgi:hypothetical protein
MNKFLVCAAVLALSSSVLAENPPQLMAADCVHLNYPGHFASVSDGYQTKVYGPVVPANEVWILETADVYTPYPVTPSLGQEFMLEVIEPLPDETGYPDSSGDDAQIQHCCLRIAVGKAIGTYGTPFLALSRSILLRPGQRLAGRTSAPYRFGITATMTRYPGACLAALQWGR